MWVAISRIILRNRLPILIGVGLLTILMGYMATKVKMRYKFGGLLPKTDSASVEYQKFIKEYGEDGNVLVIGVDSEKLYELNHFLAWRKLGDGIKTINGVDSVISIAHMQQLSRDDQNKRFVLKPIPQFLPESQAELDSILADIRKVPLFEDLLYTKDNKVNLMMVFLNAKKFNSQQRGDVAERILEKAKTFNEDHLPAHYSGLPYIRTVVTAKVKRELKMFIVLAISVTSLILLIFFKSFKVVMFSMLVVLIGVIFSFGIMGILGFEITLLMGLIPPLIIVIGIPNCVYLLTKYQSEFKKHKNKIKALTRVIQKVGNATFMTNTTTALGFATFIFTESRILQEFGIIAAVNILGVFFLSILLIPTIFSYLSNPKKRHTKHLERKWLDQVVELLVTMVTSHRKKVYLVAILVVIIGVYGITKMVTTGKIVDDLPSNDPILTDLKFFERNFKGVMPFEILIDTKEPKQVLRNGMLNNIEKAQNILKEYPEFSKSLSIVDAFKAAHQSFYKSKPEDKYRLPNKTDNRQMKALLFQYIRNSKGDGNKFASTFLDSLYRKTRITAQVADIGTLEMEALVNKIQPRLDALFNPDKITIENLVSSINKKNEAKSIAALNELNENHGKFSKNLMRQALRVDSTLANFMAQPSSLLKHPALEKVLKKAQEQTFTKVTLTGTSVVFLKGTNYLVKNLFTSLAIAIGFIASLMALLFRSFRMVLVSLLPNFIPLILTAAIMGYFGIPIKPSTILVFSIAFGISVDDTIHFLAKYRQELNHHNSDIKTSVLNALRETGVSMIYTSIILFFGFSMFSASEFGGTQALGILVSFTLLIAMLTNLVLLPSLLLSYEKSLTTKIFKEPIFDIIEEENDLDDDDEFEDETTSNDNYSLPSKS